MKVGHSTLGQQHNSTDAPHTRPAQSSQHSEGTTYLVTYTALGSIMSFAQLKSPDRNTKETPHSITDKQY
jgi:hypothetical protein